MVWGLDGAEVICGGICYVHPGLAAISWCGLISQRYILWENSHPHWPPRAARSSSKCQDIAQRRHLTRDLSSTVAVRANVRLACRSLSSNASGEVTS